MGMSQPQYPQVDYSKLAGLANLKNAASATTSYLSAKKKMLSGGTVKLTPREREILCLAWQCLTKAPEVDYKLLSEKAKLKNAASATTSFLAAKKKLLASPDGDDESAPRAKKRRKTSKASTALVADEGSVAAPTGDDDEETKVHIKQERRDDEEAVDSLLFSSAQEFLKQDVKKQESDTEEAD